jgi:Fungal Zn(2)-Cys(6) binuclear cluster domain
MHSEPCAACERELRHCDLNWPICSECSKLSSECGYENHFGIKIDVLSIEIAASFDDISEEITTLHRLSNTIRKASMDARNIKIDDTFPLLDEEGRDIKEDLKLMFTNLVSVTLPEAPQNVRERVATTMFVRRRRACYRQGQNDKSKTQEPAVIQSILSVANDPLQGQPSSTPTASAKPGVTLDLPQRQLLSDPKLNVPNMGQMPNKDGSQVQTATTLSHQQFLKASTPSVASSTMGRTVAMDTLQDLPFPPRPRVYDRMKYDEVKPAIITKHVSNIQELLAAEVLYLRKGIFNKGLDIKKLIAAEKMSYRDQRQKAKKGCEFRQGTITCPICLCLFDKKNFSSQNRWR